MQQPFVGLYAAYYDVLFPSDQVELDFYRYFLKSSSGPVLEIACGAGNLLCAYRSDGFDVRGLDCSQTMLDCITQKAQRAGMKILLYHQALEDLDLPEKFQTIYIPSCAFMFITDRQLAFQTLKRLYEHLLPGGRLILSWFTPHLEMSLDLYKRHCVRDVALSRTRRIVMYQSVTYDLINQLRTSHHDVELLNVGHLPVTEQHSFVWRWYDAQELAALVRAAGFVSLDFYGDYALKPLLAFSSTDYETLLLSAVRSYAPHDVVPLKN